MIEPQPRNQWNWGFTPSAESWNGRLAMIGFISAVILELTTGHKVFCTF